MRRRVRDRAGNPHPTPAGECGAGGGGGAGAAVRAAGLSRRLAAGSGTPAGGGWGGSPGVQDGAGEGVSCRWGDWGGEVAAPSVGLIPPPPQLS